MLAFGAVDPGSVARWVQVHDRVRDGAMPPKSAEAPDAAERAAFLTGLSEGLAAADRERDRTAGRSIWRRLNRYEYENTVRDLLGAPWLQLRDKLALTPAQAAAAQDSFNRMEAAARPLGAELVARERALDDLFRTAAASPADVAAQTEAIGALQGRLRAVHLHAHIEMRALLTAGQVAAYDRLRGYASGTAPAHGHAPG